MDNILIYKLELQEMMSGALKKLRGTTHTEMGAVDKDIARTRRGLVDLGRPTKLEVDTTGVRRAKEEVDELSSKVKRLKRESAGAGTGPGNDERWGRGGGMMGSMMMGSLAAEGVVMAGRKVVDTGRTAFDNGIELENMKVGLQTFVGNRADAIVEKVLKQAFYTPFTTQSLLPIEMGFIATGMKEERANRDMLNIANAVAATGGNSETLNRIGSDMMGGAAKGTIQGREVMELQRTGHINIASLIAKDLYGNMPLEKGMKKVEDMDIPFTVFEHALQTASDKGGMFAGALDRLSQTIGGKNSTIKDMWWNMTAKLTESQSGAIKRIQDGIIAGLTDIPGMLEKTTPVLTRMFDEFNEILPSLRDFGSGIGDMLKPMGKLLLSEGAVKLEQNMLELGTEITGVIVPALKGFGDALGFILDLLPDKYEKAGVFGAQWRSKDEAYDYTFKGKVPTWAKDKDVSQDEMRHVYEYIQEYQGGKLADWMNDEKQKNYFLGGVFYKDKAKKIPGGHSLGHGAFDLSAKYNDDEDINKQKKVKGVAADDDSVVGGGRKVISINFRNLVEHFTVQNNGADMDKNGRQTEEWFINMWRRLLKVVPS